MNGNKQVDMKDMPGSIVDLLYPTLEIIGTSDDVDVSWDFEQGLRGWKVSEVFAADQPVLGGNALTVPAIRMNPRLVPIGGNYWHDIPYPVNPGNQGQYLLSFGPDARGTLFSNYFIIKHAFISFLLGGIGDASLSHIALYIRETVEERDERVAEARRQWKESGKISSIISKFIDKKGILLSPDDLGLGPLSQTDPDEIPNFTEQQFTARSAEIVRNTRGRMQRQFWDVGEYLNNRIAMIHIIIENSHQGYALIDDFGFPDKGGHD